FGRAARTTAERLGGTPESTVVGGALRVAAANAVLANATLAHGLDFDDTREDAIVHTGCVAVPTSLAVGEATGASGRAALAAIVAAVEVMCSVGLAVPGKFHARHYHPTALAGTFAAAAAAGKLYGLTEDELVRAFGICGSQAAGIIEYLADGSWTKRLHPGWAAHAGVVAALLAQSGFTGPESVLEGEHGFYRAFAGDVEPARLDGLLASLGRVWELGAGGGVGWVAFQAVSVRLDRPALHGLRAASARGAPRAARGRGGDPVPHRRRTSAAPLGAAGVQARAAERLRREVQPAVS